MLLEMFTSWAVTHDASREMFISWAVSDKWTLLKKARKLKESTLDLHNTFQLERGRGTPLGARRIYTMAY